MAQIAINAHFINTPFPLPLLESYVNKWKFFVVIMAIIRNLNTTERVYVNVMSYYYR